MYFAKRLLLIASSLLLALASWPVLAACIPNIGFTSFGRTADGTQTVWRVTNNGGSAQTFALQPVGGVDGAPFSVAAGQLGVFFAPLLSSAGTTRLNAACGTVSTKAASNNIWEGPLSPEPTPTPKPTPTPASPETISQITLGAYIDRSYTISDRTTSGLLARARIARATQSESSAQPLLVANAGQLPYLGETELGEPQPAWNVWVDARRLWIEDQRYGLNNDGNLNEGTVGFDRLFGDNTIAGLALNSESLRLSGFNGSVSLHYTGVSGGPYVAHRLSPNLFVDGWLGFGALDNDVSVAGTSGTYRIDRTFATASLTGQYELGTTNWRTRPRVSLFMGNDRVGSFTDSAGNAASGTSYSYASVDASTDLNTIVKMNEDVLAQPFVRFGVRYELKRINDGIIPDSNGDPVTSSPWSGSLRIGSRFLVSNNTVIEANIGRLGLFQSGLRINEVRLAISFFY